MRDPGYEDERFHPLKLPESDLSNPNILEIMSGTRPESVNKPSSCLKPYENEEIFGMLGRGCKVS